MSAQLKESEHAPEILDEAMRLAAEGFHVFPLIPEGTELKGGKIATGKEPALAFTTKATDDPETLREWFGPGGRYVGYGLALRTGTMRKNPETGAREWLVVVDVDMSGHGKDGLSALKAACSGAGISLDDCRTRVQETPGSGWHALYWSPVQLRAGVDVLGPQSGVDIKAGTGAYIAVAPTAIDGKRYRWEDPAAPIASMGNLADLFPQGNPEPKAADRAPLPGIDPERARARAVEYLTQHAPEAVEGAGGDHTTFKVAAKLKDLGVDEAAAVELMLEHWHDGCGWSPDELAVKVANAFRYGANPPGADAPEAQFERVETDDAEPKALHPFDELNKEWAAVAEPPNTVVYRFRKDSGTGQTCFDRYTREGFMGLLANQKFEGKPLASEWWASPRRRTYHAGTDFAPGRVLPPDCLNTWGGFAVQPAPGDWSLMRNHIRDVICSGDAALDAYVMGWLARMVQHPGEPGQVALVLRGGRGTGKGTLGEMLARVFGAHGLHIGNSERLTGNFNGHLVGKVLLFADEAFYAGRRADEGTLKMLVTERALDVEAKYQAARNVRNCLHILMASNESWVVPAGPLERRFCVIDVSEARQQDNGYFGRIRDQMDRGGLGAMLHDLLHFDLSGFDVWKVPHTRAGTEQRAESLRGPERWLFDALARGRVMSQDWTDEGLQVPKDEVFADYRMRHRELGDHFPVTASGFWKRVSAALAAGGIQPKDTRPRIGSDRVLTRVLPSLTETRAAFDAWLGGVPTEWDPA